MWNILKNSYFIDWASLTQMIKNLLAMWETWVQSLNWEHPLKKGMATQSSVLAWRIPRREKPGRLQYMEFQKSSLEKATAPYASVLAWKAPWMEEPGGLQSMGSWRVGHDWATSLSLFTFMYWRRKWQPTPVFLPGESQGQGSLVGCHLWGHTESDTTEAT